MEEITENEEGIYEAIEECNDTRMCSNNQNKRNKALNKHYFNDNSGFKLWNAIKRITLNDREQLCICGQNLTAEVIIVQRGNVKCHIGNGCIKKYSKETGDNHLKEQLKELRKKRCEKCSEVLTKRTEEKHGKCKCGEKIDCRKFKICYDCKVIGGNKDNVSPCIDCSKPILKDEYRKRCIKCYLKSRRN